MLRRVQHISTQYIYSVLFTGAMYCSCATAYVLENIETKAIYVVKDEDLKKYFKELKTCDSCLFYQGHVPFTGYICSYLNNIKYCMPPMVRPNKEGVIIPNLDIAENCLCYKKTGK